MQEVDMAHTLQLILLLTMWIKIAVTRNKTWQVQEQLTES